MKELNTDKWHYYYFSYSCNKGFGSLKLSLNSKPTKITAIFLDSIKTQIEASGVSGITIISWQYMGYAAEKEMFGEAVVKDTSQ